eukprot:1741918-Pleurochrysis_carterae.AAC.2
MRHCRVMTLLAAFVTSAVVLLWAYPYVGKGIKAQPMNMAAYGGAKVRSFEDRRQLRIERARAISERTALLDLLREVNARVEKLEARSQGVTKELKALSESAADGTVDDEDRTMDPSRSVPQSGASPSITPTPEPASGFSPKACPAGCTIHGNCNEITGERGMHVVWLFMPLQTHATHAWWQSACVAVLALDTIIVQGWPMCFLDTFKRISLHLPLLQRQLRVMQRAEEPGAVLGPHFQFVVPLFLSLPHLPPPPVFLSHSLSAPFASMPSDV